MNYIFNNAIKIFLGLLILIILFHLSIITKIVPYDITWGGRLQNDSEMYVFETISILLNVFLSWVLLMKGNWVTYKFPNQVVNIILWVFFAIFILNTIGNIFAKTFFEQQFAFLTGLFSILLWIILKRNTK
jgi:hypothetical protein